MVEMQLHVGLLAQHIRLTYDSERPAELELEPQVNLRSKHRLFMSSEQR